jgi:DNA-binding SARP family transcriptional activator
VPTLKVYLLGQVRAHAATAANSLHFPTKKSKSLLAYLVLYKERTFARPSIAGQFWPELDEDRALRSLNTEVWRLRALLKIAGLNPGAFLQSDHECIGFREDCDHWVDAAEFDTATRAMSGRGALPRHQDALSTLTRAVGLYRGDLVDGLFDEWCLVEREAYRARYMAALDLLLTAAMEDQHWQDALSYGQRLLQLDPLQEHVHRALMRSYFNLGNRPAALRQYRACAKVLNDELQIEPMEETQEVHRAIMASRSRSGSINGSPCGRRSRASRSRPVESVNAALTSLAAAQACLEDARHQLDRSDADNVGN